MSDSTIPPEEYDVFSAVALEALGCSDFGAADDREFLFEKRTLLPDVVPPCADWAFAPIEFRYLHRSRPDLTRDFETKNAARFDLEGRFRAPGSVRFVGDLGDSDRVDAAVSSFSRVGFDATHDLALVWLRTMYCNGGSGWLFLLERTRDGWRLKSRAQAWHVHYYFRTDRPLPSDE